MLVGFWPGFIAGGVFILIAVALCLVWIIRAEPESQASRMARELREARRQVDLIFAQTSQRMENYVDEHPNDLPKNWKEKFGGTQADG